MPSQKARIFQGLHIHRYAEAPTEGQVGVGVTRSRLGAALQEPLRSEHLHEIPFVHVSKLDACKSLEFCRQVRSDAHAAR